VSTNEKRESVLADREPTIEAYDAPDGYCIHYRHWMPSQSPLARVVALHGIQSHSGWYLHSTSRLCEAGFEVFYLDRRGSGLNQEQRGHADNFHVLLDDLVLFTSRVRVQEPRRPIILVGVSWGGKLATALAKEHPQLVDGLVLICPGLFPKIEPPWYQQLRIVLARICGRYRHFTIPLTDPGLFTANPKWLQFLRTDPLSLHRATASMLVASRRLDWFVRDAPQKIDMPALLMQAELDRIIDCARTSAYFERFASKDKQVIVYQGAHHTLEFEPSPEPFITDLIEWISQHVKGSLARP
jgi:alpha-beta hydrolase superfamily lysophospholipase